MKKRFYNLLLVVTLIVLFGGIFKFVNAQTQTLPPQTLISYPTIEGAGTIAFGMSLPEMIKYIYLFAVGICGAIALAAILLGAIKYIGAAGNSSKMADAKEQIVSAILGVVILLSSYLILYTINPDLVKIGLSLPIIKTDKLEDQNIVRSYECVCRCEKLIVGGLLTLKGSNYADVVINSNFINGDLSRLPWAADGCKNIAFGRGWSQCEATCKAFLDTALFGLIHKTDICGSSFLYKNSALRGCSINE